MLQKRKSPVLWLDVTGLGDAALVQSIGEHFGIHRLALEDVLHPNQRPKVERHEEVDFVVVRMARIASDDALDVEQVSMFLGKDFVITFQERHGDVFEPVRNRIRESRGRIRGQKSDYLLYALVDAVVDNVFPIVEKISERLEDEEDKVLRGEDEETAAERIYDIRRELILLRRAIWPLREAVNELYREDSPRITEDVKPYLRDVSDHTMQLVDLLESEREVVGTLMDVHLTQVSNRMNEVMKVLTIIATIFIPLGFLAGLYGMNFDPGVSPYNMPELSWFYGYPFALSIMALIAIAMLFFFRRKGWL